MMLARLGAALVALAAAVALLLLPLPLPRNSIAVALEDAGHLPLVFALCLLCLWVLSATRLSLAARCLTTLFIGVAFGAATEILQDFTGRDASWADLRSDALGATSAVALHWLWATFAQYGVRNSFRQWPMLNALAAATVFIAALLWLLPLSNVLLAWREREQRYPVLYAADFVHTGFFVQAVGTTARPLQPQWRAGRLALRVRCGTARFSGVTLEGLPRDWRAWHALRVDVSNPTDAPFELGIHVREAGRRMAYDERFNIHLPLRAREARSLVLPIADIRRGPRGKPLDIARVWSIGIFCAGDARDFELLRVALE